MPDLGKYAVEVLSAYGVSLGIICGLAGVYLLRSRWAKVNLARAEARRNA